jgi:hypothetical protein
LHRAAQKLGVLSAAKGKLADDNTNNDSLTNKKQQPVGLVVLCSSMPLKVRVVTRELKRLGFDVVGLSDTLWPDSTRAKKGQTRRGPTTSKKAAAAIAAVAAAAALGSEEGTAATKEEEELSSAGDEPGGTVEVGQGSSSGSSNDARRGDGGGGELSRSAITSLQRRADLLHALKEAPKKAASPSSSSTATAAAAAAAAPSSTAPMMKLVVTDQFRTRGLHLDDVEVVFILGSAANADTYLHLAGRTARWPRVEGGAVVTIAPEKELRKLRSWSAELGGVEFNKLDL